MTQSSDSVDIDDAYPIDDSDDTEMMISDTGANEMASGGTDNGSPVDMDGTADAEGGTEGRQMALADGPLAIPVGEVVNIGDDS